MSCAEYTLDRVPQGHQCRILRLSAQGAVRQRLLDMGLLPSAQVEMVRMAPLGDPLELRVGERDSFIAIRRQEASYIHVCLCSEAALATENLAMSSASP